MVLCQRRVKQVDGYDGEGGGRKTTRKNWEGRGGGGRKEGRARGGSRKGSESGKIKAKSESEGRERGREKEGKLDGVEKRGLGRCFSIHPPVFTRFHSLDAFPFSHTPLSLSPSLFLLPLPYSKYVDIARDFSSREKKKKTREQKSLEQLLKKIKWSHFRYFFEI